jgi:hypothetical protein
MGDFVPSIRQPLANTVTSVLGHLGDALPRFSECITHLFSAAAQPVGGILGYVADPLPSILECIAHLFSAPAQAFTSSCSKVRCRPAVRKKHPSESRPNQGER